jgi:hypothetical protein
MQIRYLKRKTMPTAAITVQLFPRSRIAPEVGDGEPVMVATTLPSRSVVAACGPGVVKVNTPQVTCAAPNVLVQTVCVGPVTVPCR